VRAVAIAVLLWPGLAWADPARDWIAEQEEGYRGFLSRVHSSAGLMAHMQACPADVFAVRQARPKGTVDCVNTPGWCLTRCKFGDGDACFGAARVIETELGDWGDADLKFPLFMAACADGNANGCTNAAATAKNGSWIGAPPGPAADNACQYRTFQLSCDAGAAWGCFMLGMQWRYDGVEGVRDMDKAQAAFERVCALDPDGAACSSARGALDDLTERDTAQE